MPSLRRIALAGFVLALVVADDNRATEPYAPRRIDAAHLPNPWRVTDDVVSGGLPEGEPAFAELARLGVKTIISVDGAKPDVAAAKQYGLRYIHLPHGYHGIEQERVAEIAHALLVADGPFYIHCHHGKHRSPAAAAAACIVAGKLPPEAGAAVLKAAGTGAQYVGLHETVRAARPADVAQLRELRVPLRETVELPPLAEAMVAIDHSWERLQKLLAAERTIDVAKPEDSAAHQALLLREQYTELLRAPDLSQKSDRFRLLLRDSEQRAMTLEQALAQLPKQAEFKSQVRAAAEAVVRDCQVCHQEFRDRPRAGTR